MKLWESVLIQTMTKTNEINKRPILKVSKTDAAKRQLETAIRLWFFSGEPVSIHTLASAALQILHDLGNKRGVPTILHDSSNIRPEYVKKFHELVSRYENFFKHADKDPDGLLEFNPEGTEVYMLDAVLTYERLTQEAVSIFTIYKTWTFIQKPELMLEEPREKMISMLKSQGLYPLGIPKSEFFTHFQSNLLKQGIQ
jgi:hypothetical protein